MLLSRAFLVILNALGIKVLQVTVIVLGLAA
jgi:hypothetical protein